jgi:hypothetical protein
MDKVQNSVILSVNQHRQNALESEYLLDLFFDPEYTGIIFLGNVAKLLSYYKILHLRRQ